MENEQGNEQNSVELSVFMDSAFAGIVDALEFARNGNAQALQAVTGEIVTYYVDNYTVNEDAAAAVAEVLNAVSYASIIADEAGPEEIVHWLAGILIGIPGANDPDAIENYLADIASNEGEQEDMEKTDIVQPGERSQDGGAEIEVVDEAQTEEAVDTEDAGEGTEPLVMTLAQVIDGMKSQSDNHANAVLEAITTLTERVTGLERALTVTAPKSQGLGATGAKSQRKQPKASPKTTEHHLKFGMNGIDNDDRVDNEAVERMLRFGPSANTTK